MHPSARAKFGNCDDLKNRLRSHPSKIVDQGQTSEIDHRQFLDEQTNPGKYRPETQNTNWSRKMEDKTEQYGGD